MVERVALGDGAGWLPLDSLDGAGLYTSIQSRHLQEDKSMLHPMSIDGSMLLSTFRMFPILAGQATSPSPRQSTNDDARFTRRILIAIFFKQSSSRND